MKTLQLRVPDSIHAELKQRAQQEGVSRGQLLVVAASNEKCFGETRDFFRQAATRYNPADFAAALAQVADTPALAGDELPG